jgi:hypothetical protein
VNLNLWKEILQGRYYWGKPRHRWKNDIEIDLKDLEWKERFAWLWIENRGGIL